MKKFTLSLISCTALMLGGIIMPADAQSSYVRTYGQTGAPNATNAPAALAQCSNGNLLLCWNETSQGYGTISRIDATGYPVWSMSLGDANAQTSHFINSVGENTDGTIWVFGTHSTATFTRQYFLTELSQAGAVNWTKFYYSFDEIGYANPSCHKMYDDGYMINLSVSSHLQLLRTDADGNLMWGEVFKTDSNEYKHPGFAGVPTYDGGFVMTGKEGNSLSLVKINLTGGVDWGFSFDPLAAGYCHTKDICQLSDGSLIAGGFINQYAFLMKVDIAGNISWIKHFMVNSFNYMCVYRIHPLSNGNFLACGTNDNMGENSGDFMLKMDSNGNLISAVQHNSVVSVLGMGIEGRSMVNQTDELFVAQCESYFPGSPVTLSKIGGSFETSCNTTPFTITLNSLSVPSMSSIMNTVWTDSDGIEVTGSVLSTFPINLDVSFLCVPTGVTEPVENSVSNLYPNPSANGSVLSFKSQVPARWTIVDATGRTVLEGRAQAGSNTLPDMVLSSGMYVFRLTDDEGNILSQEKLIRD
ncbi:MAG: T9SS type A sorting domain-containing protein [Bacteroidia bacterium]|jgi:hypothetical protein|nr:T9SS type A sorting domain-containing protein [Bacteroidia bacterium]